MNDNDNNEESLKILVHQMEGDYFEDNDWEEDNRDENLNY